MLLACLLVAPLFAGEPEVDLDEILRRGDYVEHIGPWGNDDAVVRALAPPADDSHKWFVTVINAPFKCDPCNKLKADLRESKWLKALVDVSDQSKSWAHFNAYSAGDETQMFRFRGIKIHGYPTVIVQPPRNGEYGKPSTVVYQHAGYTGDKELATEIVSAIKRYVRALTKESRQGGAIGGRDPPFDLDRREPVFPLWPDPVDVPPKDEKPAEQVPPPIPWDAVVTLVAGLIQGVVPWGAALAVLAFGVAYVVYLIRKRKKDGERDGLLVKMLERLQERLDKESEGESKEGEDK